MMQTPPTIEQVKQLAFQLSSQDLLILSTEIQTQLAKVSYNSAIGDGFLSDMANDPDIQAEIAAIQQEFAVAEMDGLAKV